MIIGVDASNIRAGGGLTHLREMLQASESAGYGLSTVHVWCAQSTKTRFALARMPWVEVHTPVALDGCLLRRRNWVRCHLDRQLQRVGVDGLLVPGGTYIGCFRPFVAFAQNLLPFSRTEQRREGWSVKRLRLMLLRRVQARTFARADGVIFMSQSSEKEIVAATQQAPRRSAVVYHGVHSRFLRSPRVARTIAECPRAKPFRWLYVSIVEPYKHQWSVVAAVGSLLRQGAKLRLDLVGPGNPKDVSKLRRSMRMADPAGEHIHYHDRVPYEEIHRYYAEADAFIFASSCETFGMILTEAMASGLPIAASDRSVIREVAGDAAVYFDPEEPQDIAAVMQRLMENRELRSTLANRAYERAQEFTWDRCAKETFRFVHEVVRKRSSAAAAGGLAGSSG
ncbi:MAG: glycosyltransferase family 4 protein [Opitutaceae bacterium]